MKRLLTRGALLLLLCAALTLPAPADSVTDSISVCIGYFGWTEDEYVEKAKFSWQELDDWYGGALDTHEEFYSYTNGSGRTYLVFARGFYIRDLLDYAGGGNVFDTVYTGGVDFAYKTIYLTAGLDAVETVSQQSGVTLLTDSGFADIRAAAACQQDVLFCTNAGLMTGTSASTFEPNKAVTREQLAKFLFNYAVYQGMDAVALSENLSSFADHDTVSGYAVPAMQWAVGQGLINGTDGKLLPTGTATRCQFAAILNRFTALQSEKA